MHFRHVHIMSTFVIHRSVPTKAHWVLLIHNRPGSLLCDVRISTTQPSISATCPLSAGTSIYILKQHTHLSWPNSNHTIVDKVKQIQIESSRPGTTGYLVLPSICSYDLFGPSTGPAGGSWSGYRTLFITLRGWLRRDNCGGLVS